MVHAIVRAFWEAGGGRMHAEHVVQAVPRGDCGNGLKGGSRGRKGGREEKKEGKINQITAVLLYCNLVFTLSFHERGQAYLRKRSKARIFFFPCLS